MRSGDLDQRVDLLAFQADSPPRTATGDLSGSFVVVAEDLPAGLKYVGNKSDPATFDRGANVSTSEGKQTERSTVFRMRYRAGLVETMRVRHEGTDYEIERVQRLGRKSGVELYCRAVDPAPLGTVNP